MTNENTKTTHIINLIMHHKYTILPTLCYPIVCNNNTWGPGCHLNCHCISGSCHHVNGTCESGCEQGWTGDTCQELLLLHQSMCYLLPLYQSIY